MLFKITSTGTHPFCLSFLCQNNVPLKVYHFIQISGNKWVLKNLKCNMSTILNACSFQWKLSETYDNACNLWCLPESFFYRICYCFPVTLRISCDWRRNLLLCFLVTLRISCDWRRNLTSSSTFCCSVMSSVVLCEAKVMAFSR